MIATVPPQLQSRNPHFEDRVHKQITDYIAQKPSERILCNFIKFQVCRQNRKNGQLYVYR